MNSDKDKIIREMVEEVERYKAESGDNTKFKPISQVRRELASYAKLKSKA